jgi:6-pyruvoyltetrahydropterin/6-carboxytetrahydropterin synthase
MTYRSTKTYGHELGLSACFRQWRADSHCRLLHGYALAFTFTFEADELDLRNWVVDFGSLKSLKGFLEDHFDHKMLVAEDDPALEEFERLSRLGLASIRILPAVGCEAFAEYIGEVADLWLYDNGYKPRVRLVSCECREHGANSAIWINSDG